MPIAGKRKTYCLLFVLVVACSPLSAHGATMVEFSPSAFVEHVDYLASNALAGRGLGSEGIERAAEYIAKQFKDAGLKPAGENNGYFQSFEVKLSPTLTGDGYLGAAGITGDEGEEYVPFHFSSEEAFEGDLVFAGYGIVNPDKDHDDFVHLDVADRVVLILRREPPSWSDEEGNYTPHAMFSNKVYNAKDRGAAAVLIVNQAPMGDEEDRLTRWSNRRGSRVGSPAYGLPALHVSREFANRLLEAGSKPSLTAIQEKLDAGEYQSFAVMGVRVRGMAGIHREQATTRNVLGMLRGHGPLANEVVVIGAHYDHLGVSIPRGRFGRDRRTDEVKPQVHNGADDNASGTSGIIELAEALSRRRDLKRSILFIAFSGEESGLLGSKHFVEHSTVALDRIVAMLNLDMIGRLPNDSNEVQVFGTEAAKEFSELIEQKARPRNLDVRGSASAIGPSDHASFYKKEIPSLHFFTGLHEDYHRPGDDTTKVNVDGAAAVLGLVYDVAVELVNADQAPTYNKVDAPARTGRRGLRVVMGVMPSYADSEEGMVIDGVLDDGPAKKAGMQADDVIVRIGDHEVKNIYDYMAALRNNKPGDSVHVTVQRDGRKVELTVVLTAG